MYVEHPELHWRLVDRTKHGKMTVSSRHVKVEFYIHHDEYRNAAELADMLAQFAGECDYNVGVGQVLGAVAVRWEELL